MDNNLQDSADEFSKDVKNAAEDAWKAVEDAANTAKEKTEDVLKEASKTIEGTWEEARKDVEKASEEVAAAKADLSEPAAETERWGGATPPSTEDTDRWTGELYTPEQAGPEEQRGEFKSASSTGPARTAATPSAEKKSFPVWAIVLIVLLVLCICIGLPLILIVGGALNWASNAMLLIPLLV
jgi:vacuolar-type H+-ATPase subunit H